MPLVPLVPLVPLQPGTALNPYRNPAVRKKVRVTVVTTVRQEQNGLSLSLSLSCVKKYLNDLMAIFPFNTGVGQQIGH